jgi:hypothetical protein
VPGGRFRPPGETEYEGFFDVLGPQTIGQATLL